MKVTTEGNEIVIRIPIPDTLERSNSGKTLVVASTHGNTKLDIQIKGRPVFLGLNAYIYPQDKRATATQEFA